MLLRAMRAVLPLAPTPLCIVVGHQAREVEALARAAFPNSADLAFALQAEQRGTGHATRCGIAAIARDFAGDILVTYGDLPMLSPATLKAFRAAHRAAQSCLSFISAKVADAGAYGRVIRDFTNGVTAIVEARDATSEQRAITEINTGVYLVDAAFLREALDTLAPNNAQGEYYLTDIVALARARRMRVLGWRASDASEFAGINSREELATMEADIRDKTNRALMAVGSDVHRFSDRLHLADGGNLGRYRYRTQCADSRYEQNRTWRAYRGHRVPRECRPSVIDVI